MSSGKKEKLDDLWAEAFATTIILAIIVFVPGVASFLIGILKLLSAANPLAVMIGMIIGTILSVWGQYTIWKIARKVKTEN